MQNTMKLKKRSKAQRVARPACANLSVHFLFTYRVAMLVPPSEWSLKPVQCPCLRAAIHPLQSHRKISEVTGPKSQNVRWPRRMLPLVSHCENEDGTDRRTDGERPTPDRYITLSARRDQRNITRLERVAALLWIIFGTLLANGG